MSLKFSQLGARQQESNIARLMTIALQRPDLLSLAAGFTDNDTLPLAELTEIAGELGEEGDRKVLQYGSNQGSPRLREIMTSRLEKQDESDGYETDLSLISNGSQQALYLAVQTLCDPGDIVLVEEPTYFVLLEMLRGLGVEAVSLPMADDGDVDSAALEEMLTGFSADGIIDRVKAVYIVSYFSNPSGHSVSRQCKRSLLDLLSRFEGRIALFEDAAYRDLYYESPFDAESCLAFGDAKLSKVPVFYSTTLTKPFATGLKVGYAYCTHRDWLSRMLAVKGQQDFGTANYNQALLVRALEKGVFDEHLGDLRKSYHAKMLVLENELRARLENTRWKWQQPEGGLYLWLTAPEEIETGFSSEFHDEAIKAGVMYVPGELCVAQSALKNKVRLSFGVLHLSGLKIAAERFCKAISTFSASEKSEKVR